MELAGFEHIEKQNAAMFPAHNSSFDNAA